MHLSSIIYIHVFLKSQSMHSCEDFQTVFSSISKEQTNAKWSLWELLIALASVSSFCKHLNLLVKI